MEFVDTFAQLDTSVWTESYLPAWSSRADAAATYVCGSTGLVLSIPPEQGLWCADLHPTPLRVSAVHSANRSGAVGSRDAPQPFVPGQVVREQQPRMIGFAPHHGHISVTCSAELSGRSMFSAWMVGLEEHPEQCGELCLVEVFGRTVAEGRCEVGQGVHRFRDPSLEEDFGADVRTLDVAASHTYAVDWRPDGVTFSIDGAVTRTSAGSPDYPMMLILGVFDFPAEPGDSLVTPRLTVTEVRGTT